MEKRSGKRNGERKESGGEKRCEKLEEMEIRERRTK
jgi:hypothetical protein